MKETGKFLFLDPSDTVIPCAEAAHAAPSHSDAPVPEPKCAIAALVDLIEDSGYDPVIQLTSYIIADDPTYLPEDTEARAIARRIGRDKLLEALIELYLEHRPACPEPRS